MSILDDDDYDVIDDDDGGIESDGDICDKCECRRDAHMDGHGECLKCERCRKFKEPS